MKGILSIFFSLSSSCAPVFAPTMQSSSLKEFKRIEPEEYFRQHISQEKKTHSFKSCFLFVNLSLCTQGLRPDGRKSLLGLRPVSLSVGSISSADGSAIVRQGNTVVSCGITLELAKPRAEEPDRGFVVPNLDLPPLCHPRFKPGPPSDQAQVASRFLMEVVDNSGLVDRRSLCVSPGKLAWVINADLVCLNYDGNVLDASVKALVAGLRSVQLPSVVVEEEGVGDNSEAATGDASDHPSAGRSVKVISKVRAPLKLGPQPASCTMAVSDGKLLLDPTDEEEELSDSQITIVLGMVESGQAEEEVVHFWKAGGASVSRDVVTECTSLARKQAKRIRKMLDTAAPLNKM